MITDSSRGSSGCTGGPRMSWRDARSTWSSTCWSSTGGRLVYVSLGVSLGLLSLVELPPCQDAPVEEILPHRFHFYPAGQFPLIKVQDPLQGTPIVDGGVRHIRGCLLETGGLLGFDASRSGDRE
jgi:hypothetical protein